MPNYITYSCAGEMNWAEILSWPVRGVAVECCFGICRCDPLFAAVLAFLGRERGAKCCDLPALG